jgi:hypothetical protein
MFVAMLKELNEIGAIIGSSNDALKVCATVLLRGYLGTEGMSTKLLET